MPFKRNARKSQANTPQIPASSAPTTGQGCVAPNVSTRALSRSKGGRTPVVHQQVPATDPAGAEKVPCDKKEDGTTTDCAAIDQPKQKRFFEGNITI
jgi:hypothetical protein